MFMLITDLNDSILDKLKYSIKIKFICFLLLLESLKLYIWLPLYFYWTEMVYNIAKACSSQGLSRRKKKPDILSLKRC